MKRKVLFLAVASLLALPLLALNHSRESSVVKADDKLLVKEVAGQSGLTTSSDWTSLEQHALTGEDNGYLQFAAIGSNFFLKFHIVDDTNVAGKEKIDFQFTVDGKHEGRQGNFEKWFAPLGANDFGEFVQIEESYEDGAYTMVLGWNLGESLVRGNVVDLSFNYHNADESNSWGEGKYSHLEANLLLLGEPVAEPTYVITAKDIAQELVDADFDGLDKYALTGEDNGYLQFVMVGTRLYLRFNIEDDSYFYGSEKIDFQFTTNGKHEGRQGNFDNWFAPLGANDFGEFVQLTESYANGAYDMIVGWNLGESAIQGNKLNLEFNYHNAGEGDGWGAGALSQFAGELYLLDENPYAEPFTISARVVDEEELSDLDNWKGVASTKLECEFSREQADICQSSFQVMWDGKTLYSLVKTNDALIDTWDQIEFAFNDGTNNSYFKSVLLPENGVRWTDTIGDLMTSSVLGNFEEGGYRYLLTKHELANEELLGENKAVNLNVIYWQFNGSHGSVCKYSASPSASPSLAFTMKGTPAEVEPATEPYTISARVVDEEDLFNLNNWKGVASTKLECEFSREQADTCKSSFQVMWDGKTLYSLVKTNDALIDTWDQIEFAFNDGTNNSYFKSVLLPENGVRWTDTIGDLMTSSVLGNFEEGGYRYLLTKHELANEELLGENKAVNLNVIYWQFNGSHGSVCKYSASPSASPSLAFTMKGTPVEEEPYVEPSYVICAKDITTELTDADFEGLDKYLLEGADKGYLQFVMVGTRLYMRFNIEDATNFKGAEKLDFEFTVGGKHEGRQGNIDEWFAPLGDNAFGNFVQMNETYANGAYDIILGWDLADAAVQGNVLAMTLHYHNAGEGQSWGEGALSQFVGDLYLLDKEPATPIVAEPSYVIGAKDITTELTDADFEGLDKYLLEGADKGYLQFVMVGTRLYMRFNIEDATNFKGAEKLDFEFTVGGKHEGRQGNIDEWFAPLGDNAFGNFVQMNETYANGAYDIILGWDLADAAVQGNVLAMTLHYHNAGEGQSWGEGALSQFVGDLYLLDKEPVKVNTYIIHELPVDGAGYATADSWTNIETYDIVGENPGEIAFAYDGNNLFFKFFISDETYFKTREKLVFTIAIADKFHGQQGNFDPWLTTYGQIDFGSAVQLEMNYDQALKGYTALLAYNTTDLLTRGQIIDFTLMYFDGTSADAEWGAGAKTEFTVKLYVETIHEHTFSSDWSYDDNNHWHAATCEHDTVVDALGAHTYDEGVVTVQPTEEVDGVRTYTCTVCGHTYDEVIPAIGHVHTFAEEWSYDETHHWHEATCNHDEIDGYAEHSFTEWTVVEQPTQGHEGHSERECEVCGYKETQVLYYVEGQVAGPENTDLGIIVTDLDSIPTSAAFDATTHYALLPIYGDTTGASGYLTIVSAYENLFYRLFVNDPAIHSNADGLYILIETVGEDSQILYESRGNFEQWLATKVNVIGNPSLFVQSIDAEAPLAYKPGTLEFQQGFYIPDYVQPGEQLHIVIKFRDSRNSSETWMDADYKHTLYFDQVVTFGEKADQTVRPVTDVSSSFKGTTSEVTYNKATIEWNAIEGADNYKLFVFAVNPQGSEEPYTHLGTEGPYFDETHFAEVLRGLDESTQYVVQIHGYDAKDNEIVVSPLVPFATMSRAEYMAGQEQSDSASEVPSEEPTAEPSAEPSTQPSVTPSTDTNSEEPTSTDSGKKKGCKGGVATGGLISLLALAGIMFAKKRR